MFAAAVKAPPKPGFWAGITEQATSSARREQSTGAVVPGLSNAKALHPCALGGLTPASCRRACCMVLQCELQFPPSLLRAAGLK